MTDAVIVICSRPESSRVPGKVFREIAGVPAINHILERVRRLRYPVVLAVPPKTTNIYDGYIDTRLKPIYFEGHADSPLHRMAAVMNGRKEQYVVRITHDDILSDAQSIEEMVDLAIAEQAGYVYNPNIFRGADAEVIHRDNIMCAAAEHQNPTEYISYFVKGSRPNPKVVRFQVRPSIARNYRLSMDYEEDAKLLEIILRQLGSNATSEQICGLIDENPWLLKVNKLPKISVYTCVRNGEKHIMEAMTSVLSQTVNTSDFEYIIVDDYSNDGTLLEISKLLELGAIKLHINDFNLGLASSSNVALRKAKGKYVIRLDADDKLYPEALEEMSRMMDVTDADICYPAYTTGDGKVYDPRTFTHAGGAMMRLSVLNEIRFKEGLKHWDSADLYARMKDRGHIVFHDKPLFFYRQRNDSMSAVQTEERENAKRLIGA